MMEMEIENGSIIISSLPNEAHITVAGQCSVHSGWNPERGLKTKLPLWEFRALFSSDHTCCSMVMLWGPRAIHLTCSVLLVVEVTKQFPGPGLAGSRLTKT